jgi:phosphate transport system substrate-binding protein
LGRLLLYSEFFKEYCLYKRLNFEEYLVKFFALFFFILNSLFGADLAYVGSSTIGKTVFPTLAKEFSQKTSHSFSRIENPGSGKGVAALIAGGTDIAGISRPIKESDRKANLRFFIIGYDAIGVVVHKDNPVANLSMEQIAGIFSGKIANWSEVGGKDTPIEVVVEKLGEKRATQIVFTEIVFDTKVLIGIYSPTAIELDMPIDEVNYVKTHPNAITAVSMVFVKDSSDVKAIGVNGVAAVEKNIADGSYSISRPLILLTKSTPKAPVVEFLEYIFSKEAQEIINKTFVASRPGGIQ